MRGHAGDRVWHRAARAPDAGALEQDHFPSRSEWVSDGGIPIVHCSCEMLQAQKRQTRARSEAAIGVSLFARRCKFCRRGDVAFGFVVGHVFEAFRGKSLLRF